MHRKLTDKVKVLRKARGYVKNGRWVSGGQQSFLIDALIRPFSGEQLAQSPEGSRLDEKLKVWTEERLIVETGSDGQDSDLIVYMDFVYKVTALNAYVLYPGLYQGIVERISNYTEDNIEENVTT